MAGKNENPENVLSEISACIDENAKGRYETLLQQILRDENLKDPLELAPSLEIKGILTRNETESICRPHDSNMQQEQRRLILWKKLLPLKTKSSTILALYEICTETNLQRLTDIITEVYPELPKKINRAATNNPHKGPQGILKGYRIKDKPIFADFIVVALALPMERDVIEDLKAAYTSRHNEIMQQEWSLFYLEVADDFKTDKMFIELEIINKRPTDEDKVANYEDFFGASGGRERDARKIILEGSAGMGKSTYVHKIAIDWANGDPWLNHTFNFVFLFRLGAIKPEETFFGAMSRLLISEDRIDTAVQNFKRQKLQEKILLIFDGFDEFRDPTGNSEFTKIIQDQCIPGLPMTTCTIVLTSRIEQVKLIENKDRLLRTTGFSEEKVQEIFLQKHREVAYNSLSNYQKAVYCNPLFFGMAHVLHAKAGRAPVEVLDLIREFVKHLVFRWFALKKPKIQIEPEELLNKLQKYLSELAFNALKLFEQVEGSNAHTLSKLKSITLNLKTVMWKHSDLLEAAFNIGLLKRSPNRPANALDYFPHRIFAEFFASQYGVKDKTWLKNLSVNTQLNTPIFYFLTGLSEDFASSQDVMRSIFDPNNRNTCYCYWIYKSESLLDSIRVRFQEANVNTIVGNCQPGDGYFLSQLVEKLHLSLYVSNSERLTLKNLVLDTSICQILKLFPNCTILALTDCNVQTAQLKYLENITCLKINRGRISQVGLNALLSLHHQKKLKTITLCEPPINWQTEHISIPSVAVKCVRRKVDGPLFVHLPNSSVNLDVSPAYYPHFFPNHPSFTSKSFAIKIRMDSAMHATEKCVIGLENPFSNKSKSELISKICSTVSAMSITDSFYARLTEIFQNVPTSSVEVLCLQIPMSSEHIDELHSFVKRDGLVNLLSSCVGMKVLSLSLFTGTLPITWYTIFHSFPSCLERLALQIEWSLDAVSGFTAFLGRADKLRSLILSEQKFYGAKVPVIAVLQWLPSSLEELGLPDCDLDDSVVPDMLTFLERANKLQSLDLSINPEISSLEWIKIVEAISLEIRFLDVSGCILDHTASISIKRLKQRTQDLTVTGL